VKAGDNLGFIAEWFDVYVSQLRNWNGIRGNTIRVGQHLQIYVPENKKAYYEGLNSMSFAQKQQSSGQVMNHQARASSSKNDGEFSYYTVRSGDTLWDIAQKYNDVTINDLRRLNNLAHNAKIHPGMVLKIKNL
jgi:membrane-bound lytic murein transglycosylase D